MYMVLFEGIVMCFILLLVCVVGIAKDGPVGLVTFYEKDVQDRVVELGLTTKEKIRKSTMLAGAAVFLPMVILVPWMVYGINGVYSFRQAFLQMTAIVLIAGLFDRLFIDWYWVGHTNAWIIPGTEDLQPYIAGRTLLFKWISTLVFHPLLCLLIAYIMSVVL